MPSIYALKPRFQALLRPLAARLHAAGISANAVTLTACAVSVALGIGVAVAAQQRALFLLIPAWMFLRMAANAIDGMLAREFGDKSALGAYLNELTDVVADTALYLPFVFLPHFTAPAILAVCALGIVSEYTGALGLMVGATRRYDGPMGKSDRAFVFGTLGFAVGCGLPAWNWLVFVPWGVAALLALTIVNRIRAGLAEADLRAATPSGTP